MEHLKQCPSGKSPNKDFLIGMYHGMDEAYLAITNDFSDDSGLDVNELILLAEEENMKDELVE